MIKKDGWNYQITHDVSQMNLKANLLNHKIKKCFSNRILFKDSIGLLRKCYKRQNEMLVKE